MPKNLRQIINNPYRLFYHFNHNRISRLLSDKQFLRLLFRARVGKRLDLENPTTFNEKIQWIKLYDRNPIYSDLVDKYKVREYVRRVIGTNYLIPLLGSWKSFDEIDFEKLPDKFVLKCNHDSGSVIVCKDQKHFDREKSRRILETSLKKNFYYTGREWAYKNVIPMIIAEEYLDNKGEDLPDYKFFCFNGKPEYILLCQERFSDEGLALDFYSSNWEWMDFLRPPYHPHAQKKAKKPETFDKMMHLAEKLSQGIPFVRVDFYSVDNQVYFGEMTLYPGDGFEPFEPEIWDRIFGDLLVLPKKKI